MMPLCDPSPFSRLASIPTATKRRSHVSPQIVHLLFTLVLFLMLTPQKGTCYSVYDEAPRGLVEISHKNFTAFNNRNLTITCTVNLKNHRAKEGSKYASKKASKLISFSTKGRVVLTFMTVPRNQLPLDQTQSFLHCHDPQRTSCWAEFNQDLSCLEEKMNRTYYGQTTYFVEAVCQVDDEYVCNRDWIARYPHDCWDAGHINVTRAPKLHELCVNVKADRKQQCGENQYCDEQTSICTCLKGFYGLNRECIFRGEDADELKMTENPKPSTYTAVTDDSESTGNGSGTNVLNSSDSKGTFKAIVIFLLVVAILLCIALGIVIIWSRRTRRMLEELSGH